VRLVEFTAPDRRGAGAVVPGGVLDLARAVPGAPESVVGVLAADGAVRHAIRRATEDVDPTHVLPWSGVRLLAPVPRPGAIWCIGYNYRGHTTQDDPAFPDVFTKPAAAVVGPQDAITLPAAAAEVDYEAELAVVIGRRAHRVAESEALDHVGGYTVLNDVSARDWQRHGSQWGLAKSFPTFAPLGPAVVTPDEIPDLADLTVEARVDGETTLRGSTRDLVFPVAWIVAYLSRAVVLEPGDVIATGTPQKLPHVLDRGPRWLRPGDVVEITISHVGTLRSTVVAPE
jgi:2-keto-4-pentenoate hydratase/2-oxohepta-3-ene-1,7-dioic acid hydratase in catechol pathway